MKIYRNGREENIDMGREKNPCIFDFLFSQMKTDFKTLVLNIAGVMRRADISDELKEKILDQVRVMDHQPVICPGRQCGFFHPFGNVCRVMAQDLVYKASENMIDLFGYGRNGEGLVTTQQTAAAIRKITKDNPDEEEKKEKETGDISGKGLY